MGTRLTTTENRNQLTPTISQLHNQLMADSQSEPHFSLKYCFESERLKSFENWPNRDIDPTALAKAGLYYTGQLDKTRCFHCKIEIYRWEKNDIPILEHTRYSERCRFIRNLPAGNIPLNLEENRTISYDVCGIYANPPDIPNTQPTKTKAINDINLLAENINNIAVDNIKDEAINTPDALICKLCYDKIISLVFQPCGHSLSCNICAQNLTVCPICRKKIENSIHTIFS